MRSDLELLEAWRSAGDVEAGNELFERHFLTVRRFFRNKLPVTEVEDVLQRTFLACVEASDRFRGDSSFRSYLLGIARNQLYCHIRKRATDMVAAGLDFSVSSLDNLGISPTENLAKNEAQQVLCAALRRLPVDTQIILELRHWEQLPSSEIAEIMNIAETTVRTRLFRARQALKAQLENLEGEWSQIDVRTQLGALP